MKFFKKLASFFMVLVMAFGIIPLAKCTEVAGGADETEKTAQTQPKVSVLIPVYKVEPYLRQCLDSVVNQTLKDIEIICVDDGSPDNCGKILDEYAAKDSRIKVIHQENKGLPMARQAGLDVATGEYIHFVDSDDYIDLRTLEICYNEAKKDDVDAVCFGMDRFYGYGREAKPFVRLTNRTIRSSGFDLPLSPHYIANKLVKRTCIVKDGTSFHGVDPIKEDDCFFTKLSPSIKTVKHISNVFYHYRYTPGSLSTGTSRLRTLRGYLHNACEVYKWWTAKGYFKKEKARVVFLDWVLGWLYYCRTNDNISKMFYDTLNSLDANLIRDKQVISKLSKRSKAKLAAIMKFA